MPRIASDCHTLCLPRITRLSLLVMMLALMPAMAPADNSDRLLSPRSWSDNGYGISLHPPAGAQVLPRPGDASMVRFQIDTHDAFTLRVVRSPDPLTLEAVSEQALRDASMAYTPAVRVDDRSPQVQVDGRSGFRFFLLVGDRRQHQALLGQLLVLLDAHHVLVLTMQCPASRYEQAMELFNAVTASIGLTDPGELAAQRSQLLEAGEIWLQTVAVPELNLMPEEHWFRWQRDGKDVGYMRMATRMDEQLEQDGVALSIQWRLMEAATRLDTIASYFLAANAPTEIWSARRTRRADAPGQQAGPAQSLAETGVRSGRLLSVTRETPLPLPPGLAHGPANKGQLDERRWEIPPHTYAPQLIVQLMPWLLLPRGQTDMAYYAYDETARSLTLHELRVLKQDDQGLVVSLRSGPDQPTSQITMDAQGQVRSIMLPSGDLLTPATARDIQTRWQRR